MHSRTEIACRLTTPELAARLSKLRTGLIGDVVTVVDLADGVRLSFPVGDRQIEDALDFVRFERQCCPFLGFALSLQPGKDTFTLDITDPFDAQTFIRETFVATVPTGNHSYD